MNVINPTYPTSPQTKLNLTVDAKDEATAEGLAPAENSSVPKVEVDQVSEIVKSPIAPDEPIVEKDKALEMMATFKKNAAGHLSQTMAAHSKQALQEAMKLIG